MAAIAAPSASFPRDRVGLCMIVKNEEHRLARCLASVLPWVGEAIVVDTGSSDGTVALAKRMGARVETRVWRDDFAWARNESLALGTRPWALLADADDVLGVTDEAGFARAVRQTEVTAFAIDYLDQLDGGGVQVGPVMRLFLREAPGMQFVGEVHEQLVAVARRQARVARADFLHLRHDGHTAAVMAEHRTLERNLRLSRRMSEQRPEDAFAWFCLGQSLAAFPEADKRAEARGAYETALARLRDSGAPTDESYAVTLHLQLARLRLGAGDAAGAEHGLAEALQVFPASPDLRLMRGQLLLARGHFTEAEADLRVCLSDEARAFFVREAPGATGWAAETQLGLCALKTSQLNQAETWFQSACQEAPPAFVLPRLLLATLWLARGAFAPAEVLLAEAVTVNDGNADLRLKWGQALVGLGQRDRAAEVLAPLGADPRVRAVLT